MVLFENYYAVLFILGGLIDFWSDILFSTVEREDSKG
jgi:hypothetical protein